MLCNTNTIYNGEIRCYADLVFANYIFRSLWGSYNELILAKSQNTTPTYFVKTSNLPSNISTSPAVQQQKRISIPAQQQQYTSTSLMADQNDSHHQKGVIHFSALSPAKLITYARNLGSITVGQLLRAHREQSERIDVLLSENHKLTNALAESRRQNEVISNNVGCFDS